MKAAARRTPGGASLQSRIAALDWPALAADLGRDGAARSGNPLLTPAECAALVSLWDDPGRFRSRVDMARHRFGEGEYRYFRRPLPPVVAILRRELYARLAPLATAWTEALRGGEAFPSRLSEFLDRCASAGQTRPTPLILRYGPGGYNCLHQDVYGAIAFPFQAMIPLSVPGADYAGGEFLLVEQRPRAQSAGTAILPGRGELVLFPNRFRPMRGARGTYRVTVRHGASRIASGTRYALAVIFHDAA